ncbi:DUF7065 domain-containing protein [Rhodococcus chondri]|uniref:DUF7065 domain-containing protein n=1 Tax=Rhodococcus chondri TaxID=3065941 RepID=A0ABU7JMQ2_9NOCA|nr:hypothetical protein [Rhodococcus sp. CC-R104]MEE2031313.1 hypothetical protein [Rhodococcus sp. CC-R104]
MTSEEIGFVESDDYLHPVSDNFYENETFWFSFFVPERNIGAWIYVGVRQNAGITHGGLWLWDDTAVEPWDLPFYEGFSALKLPTFDGPRLISPTGATIDVVEPGMAYNLRYNDRKRIDVELSFRGFERPVALLRGTPPYPEASHYDQTGRVTGHVILDGERIEVECCAMRDRSWGPRTERGYGRVGYTWLTDPECSLLTYSVPTDATDNVHSGYIRRGDEVSRLVRGERKVVRDPARAWVERLEIAVIDEHGAEIVATGTARSRMILPGATSVCINTLIEFEIDGRTVYGEDQDVWSIDLFRQARSNRG